MRTRLLDPTLALSLIAAFGDADIHAIRGGSGISLAAPPRSETKPVTEVIHGTSITDPYRWLEDSKSAETRAWIASQMKYTDEYLSQVKMRPEIVKRVTELVRTETYSVPIERAGSYFFTKRLPDENQASVYVRKGLTGSEVRLVDAAKLSADQNTSVQIEFFLLEGVLVVYG